MEYKIKNICLASLLKISFLIGLVVGSIIFFFTLLLISWIISAMGSAIDTMPFGELVGQTNFSLLGILVLSLFEGLIFSIFITFLISLIVIFYNIFAKSFGGVVIDIEENNYIESKSITDEVDVAEN